MRVVYIDELFALNLAVNYLLLCATSVISGTPIRRGKLLTGAALGALYAVFIYFPELGFFYTALFRVLFACAVCIVAFGFGDSRRFIRRTLTFLAVSFAFAGAIYGAVVLLKPDWLEISNGVLYIQAPTILIIICALAVYFFLKLTLRGNPRLTGGPPRAKVTLCAFGKTLDTEAALDTCSKICDPVTGDMVIVLEYRLARNLLPDNVVSVLDGCGVEDAAQSLRELAKADTASGFRLIPYRALGMDHGLMLSFRTDSAFVNGKKRRLTAALTSTELDSAASCGAILGADT